MSLQPKLKPHHILLALLSKYTKSVAKRELRLDPYLADVLKALKISSKHESLKVGINFPPKAKMGKP